MLLADCRVLLPLQVSDIKRANGLLSDSAMFARDTVLIPTRPIPIGWVNLLLRKIVALKV